MVTVSNKKLVKDILLMAVPVAGLNLTIFLVPLSIGLMLSKLGNADLAAGALITVTQSSLMIICTAPLFAISSIVARMNAVNKFFKIGRLIQQGYLLSVLLALPAIFTLIFIKFILFTLGQPANIIKLVNLYFKAYIWGIPASMLLTCSQQFMLGLKKTMLVTILGTLSLVVTVSAAYAMTFGKFGIPKFGISGLGYAQVARAWITLFFFIGVIFFKKEYNVFGVFIKRHFDKFLEMKRILKLGWPISIHAAGEFLVIFVITIFAGKLGQNELSAQQVAAQYIMLLSILMLALSQSGNILVSHSVGKQEWKNMNNYGNISTILGVALSIFALLGFILFPDLLIAPYVNIKDPENYNLISILKPFLIITMCNQIFEAIRTIYTGALRGLYDTKTPMMISIIGGWGIGVPLAYIMANILHFGINGLAMAQTISLGVCALLLFYRWRELSIKISKHDNTGKYAVTINSS